MCIRDRSEAEELASSPERPARRAAPRQCRQTRAAAGASRKPAGRAAKARPAARVSSRPRRAVRDTARAKELSSDDLEESDEEEQAQEAAAAGDGWRRRGHAWCGQRVRRFFDGVPSDGRIVRWLPHDGEARAPPQRPTHPSTVPCLSGSWH